jgi:hypothetical protein
MIFFVDYLGHSVQLCLEGYFYGQDFYQRGDEREEREGTKK